MRFNEKWKLICTKIFGDPEQSLNKIVFAAAARNLSDVLG